MDIQLAISGRRQVTVQVYRQLRDAILDGRLRGGTALPSSRELAGRLSVSRNSVVAAYERLAGEGFVHARGGAGTFVNDGLAAMAPMEPGRSPLRARPLWAAIPSGVDLSVAVGPFDFRPGIPDTAGFPYAAFRSRLVSSVRWRATRTAGHVDAAGDPDLRQEIARHVGVARGVRTRPDNVVVTSGSQQAIDLLTRVLLAPGEKVAVEDPGYPPPRGTFRAHGCEVVGVPVDEEGLVVSALPDDARLVYVTPAHQYPLGMTMSMARRQRLLAWARDHDAAVIEDDYDSEFRYSGRPLETLRALDHDGRVLYVGSLSKAMLPTLRLGYCVVPDPLLAAVRKAKHVTDWHSSLVIQQAAARFIGDGLLAEHVRRMRRVYEVRHDTIGSFIARELDDVLTMETSHCGLHLSAHFRDPAVDDRAVVDAAAASGVHLFPLSRHYHEAPPRAGLVFGYGNIDARHIRAGLDRLRTLLPG